MTVVRGEILMVALGPQAAHGRPAATAVLLGAMVTRDLDATATRVRAGRATRVRVAMGIRARAGTARGDRAERATDAVSTLRVRGRVEHPNARRVAFVRVGRTARIVRATMTRASPMM